MAAQTLICEFIYEPLNKLKKDCRDYYKKSQEEVDKAFLDSIFLALTVLHEKAISACSARGGHWTTAFLDAMRLLMRKFLGEGYLELQSQNDISFCVTFEQEWNILLKKFLDHRYNFSVAPRLSYHHMVRYQLLPSGDKHIRRTVSSHLVHQCFFYPHLGEGMIKLLGGEEVWLFVRNIYSPLIEATVAQAAKNLQLEYEEKSARRDLKIEVENFFDKSASQFKFVLQAPEGFKGRGLLGLNENKDTQKEINEILGMFGFSQRTTDINSTPFAHYIKEKLDYWVKDRYPAHREFYSENTNVVTGADGQSYITRKGVEQRFDVSATQLIYWDRIGAFKSVRAREVAPTHPILDLDIRLYPDNEQTKKEIEIAIIRAKTRSLALSGKELTRKQAAVFLEVNYNSLREMENKGLVKPEKRGQSVIYNEAILQQAKELIAKKQKKKARKNSRP